MSILQQNEWMKMNDLIYDIHTIDNLDEMRNTFLDKIISLIDYDLATFWLADFYGTKLLKMPIGRNTSEENLQKFLDNNYESEDSTAWIMRSGKSKVYRETDLVDQADRESNSYYKEIYEKQNIYYSLQMCIAYEGAFLGLISLCRGKEREDFSEKDLYILELLSTHMNHALWKFSPAYRQSSRFSSETVMLIAGRAGLTQRETEIAQELTKGLSHNEICDELYISINTLKKHITSIYRKCGVSNRFQLIQFLQDEKH